MNGLMMQRSLLASSLLTHAERHHGSQEVVSRRVEGDIHRYSFSDLAARSRRVANALDKLGISIEARVGTLAWNDYIFTRILVATDELKTLPVGVQDLFAAAVVDWGLVMAAGMLITIPALALFLAVQRHLVEGWGSGGLKG